MAATAAVTPARRSRPRVAVIGLDAAEWTLIEPMLASGALPHLARLREAGTLCRLRQPAPITEQPWTELLSGVAAPLSSLEFEPARLASFEVGAPRVPPFYARLPGLRAVVLDVPRMNPAYAMEGVQITGWGGHHLGYPRAARPRGLLSEIEREVGRHPAFQIFHECRWHHGSALDRLTDALVAGTGRRVDVLRWLAARVPDWDLLVSVAPEAHSAGEILWHGVAGGTADDTTGVDDPHPLERLVNGAAVRRQLCRVYAALDAAVGRLAAELPADTSLVVCALHGMQRNDRDVASRLLPEFLSRVFTGEGLLDSPDPAAWRRLGYPPVEPGVSQYAAVYHGQNSAAARLRRWVGHHARVRLPGLVAASRRLRRHEGGHEPETARHFDDIGENRTPIDGHVTCRYRALWPRMKAFALPTYAHGRVRINLRGRERDGLVAPDEFDAVCQEVEHAVRACRNPRTGQPVVEDVIRVCASDAPGPNDPAADLLVTWKGCADAFEHPGVGLIGPLPYDRTGAHSTRGFVLMAGPGIPHADLGERPALDLTPTIVSLLGTSPQPICVDSQSCHALTARRSLQRTAKIRLLL